MFYHVIIETTEKVGKDRIKQKLFELDKIEISEIENDFVMPYLRGEEFQFDGYFLQKEKINRFCIKQSNEGTKNLVDYAYSKLSSGIFMVITGKRIVEWDGYTTDITKQVFKDTQEKINLSPIYAPELTNISINKSQVFIVHGHDNEAKIEVARFIEKMGFEPIILHEQSSDGKTIIEKIEHYSNVGFGVVLYTPCDVGAKTAEKLDLKSRARQNVVFEHGFLIGRLGRPNVCALVKSEIETPNDISGVVYVSMDNAHGWHIQLAKELKSAGYAVDMNKII